MGLFDLFRKKPKYVPTWPEVADCYAYPGEPEDYFSELFEKEFPAYEVKKEVAVEFDQYSQAIAYTLIKNDVPVLVAIICPSYYYKRKALREVIESYEKQGIPVQRYFRDFRNDKQYVCQRVLSAMK